MRIVAIALGALLVAGCAQEPVKPKPSEEQFVVLPGADGHVGAVVVQQGGQRAVVDQAYGAARISGGGAPQAAKASPDEVKRDFGAALGAMPSRPATFLLYFTSGRDELTEQSRAQLDKVLAELKSRPVPDVMVIGHTDTVGPGDANDKLSLQRAERVKGLLTGIGIAADRIQAAGRGERELLVPTADNVAEPRNRRVEINVR